MASDFTLEPRGLVEIKVSCSGRVLFCNPSICLSVYLLISEAVCWSVYLLILLWVCLFFGVPFDLALCLSVFRCTFWSCAVFVCFSVYLLILLCVCLFFGVPFDLALCLSICRCTCWSLRLSVVGVPIEVVLRLFVRVLIGLARRLLVSLVSLLLSRWGRLKPKACVLLVWQGKGQMDTYWLLDRDGFEKSLPCMPDCRKFNDVTVRRISKTQGPTISWRIHGSRDNFGGIPSLWCFWTRRFQILLPYCLFLSHVTL